MNKAFLIFPHQLFEDNFSLSGNYIFVLVEDELFFRQYNFHKQKLILHRASMQYYKIRLIKKNKEQIYFDAHSYQNTEDLIWQLVERNVTEVHFRELHDDWLENRLKKACNKYHIKIVAWKTPAFLSDDNFILKNLGGKKHLSMAAFYTAQRKNLNILIDEDQQPIGGKWSFDTENRKKLPNNILIPPRNLPDTNKFVQEANTHVKQRYKENFGNTDKFCYATTHEEAKACLQDFLEQYFYNFGLYEDAISKDQVFLFHSVLSPYLNIGLLTPLQVIEAALTYQKEIPINAMEGFIRQIIGWREFMKAAYQLKGRVIRNSNFWNFNNSISSKFYEGNTGILPVDTSIQRLKDYAYTHHIERLMILGNFMLLCETNPHEVYKWFMETYIDAYDWVMVPNVYSMSQYACGGILTTKPYISGSNYILKMSDFPKGEWCQVWDGLYWRFINEHKSFFVKNPRLSMMARLVEQMDIDKLKSHYRCAEQFLKDL